MGSVVPLKKSANSAYLELKNLLGKKLEKVENLIELKLKSDVNLIEKMSEHHLKSGGKRLRALLTLGSAKLSGYELGDRDINLASCVELIHSATLSTAKDTLLRQRSGLIKVENARFSYKESSLYDLVASQNGVEPIFLSETYRISSA